MTTHAGSLAALLLFVLVLLPSRAHAQSEHEQPWMIAEAAPAPAPVLLELDGDEPMAITVYPAWRGVDRKRALFSCRTPCRAYVLPGKYRFHVRGGSDKVEADRVVDVQSSRKLSFTLPESSSRTEALALAISGSALAGAGLLVAIFAGLSNACYDCSSDESRNRETPAGVYIGLGMAAVGAVLAPIGWVQFGRNRKPRVEERPFTSAPVPDARKRPAPSQIGFGIAPLRGGASAGIWGSF